MNKRLLTSVIGTPLLVVAILVSSSACGTMMNFAGGPRGERRDLPPLPYGGVASDLMLPDWKNADEWHSETLLLAPVLLVDIGISAVLDTVTLPVVLWLDVQHLFRKLKPEPLPTGDPVPAPSLPTAMPPIEKPTPAESLLQSKPTK